MSKTITKTSKRGQNISYSLNSLKNIIEREKPSKVIVVTSSNIKSKLARIFKDLPKNIQVIIIPDGEKAKSWQSIEKLLKNLLEIGLDRKGLLIAIGGGSVGDSVGFAASIYLRGIKYINIPTTLLAQVDSSHGGKTGINFANAKNQIGSFYLPLSTIVDKEVIESNGSDQITDGLGEIIKAGLIKDKSILDLLQQESVDTLKESKHLQEIIEKSIDVKHFYVSRDSKDNGVRQILNFGHTIGHAIELKYKISHGRAVLIGMIKELEIGEKLKLTPPYVRENILDLYKRLGINSADKYKVDWKTILMDKKLADNTIAMPIILREGESKLVDVSLVELKKHL